MKRAASLYIFLLLAIPLAFILFKALPATAVLESHACDFCHIPHSAPEFSLLRTGDPASTNHIRDIEVLCLSCHGPGGISLKTVDVHNLDRRFGDWRRVSCRECHDPHDNQPNVQGRTNIKAVGFFRDPTDYSVFTVAKVRVANNIYNTFPRTGPIVDVVFESRGSDVGEPALNSFADGVPPRDGICEACHPDDGWQPLELFDHKGYGDVAGRTCTVCHPHDAGFEDRVPQ